MPLNIDMILFTKCLNLNIQSKSKEHQILHNNFIKQKQKARQLNYSIL